jgi:hypothetical protein
MEEEERLEVLDNANTTNAVENIIDQIVKRGAMHLYDKYLQSILPEHEICTVVDSVMHVMNFQIAERDYGEHWSDEMDEEAAPPIICTWANGKLPVDNKIVFGYDDTDKDYQSTKNAPKSTTSYLRKKGKFVSGTKLFRDFNPRPEPVKDPEKLHPKIVKQRETEKHIEVINPAFPHLDMEENIDRLRRKVEIDDKRHRIEEEIRKKKKKNNRANVAGAGMQIGNKPFTTNDDGHPILIKNVNTLKLPTIESNNTTGVNVDNKKVNNLKIESLKHLYSVPAGANVVPPQFEKPQNMNENNHVQEITALQPPPSEVLTLKAGIVLIENGNEIKGPEASYNNRMTLEQYQSKLGSRSNQRMKFHEQRIKKNSKVDISYNTQNNLSISKLSTKNMSAVKFSNKKANRNILKTRLANHF